MVAINRSCCVSLIAPLLAAGILATAGPAGGDDRALCADMAAPAASRLEACTRVSEVDAQSPSNSIATQNRVALVIGNRDYAHLPKLVNSVNDAGRVADALREIGFKVVTLTADVSLVQFIQTLKEFKRVVAGAEMALFYYNGHALQHDGINFLIPVDAQDLDEGVDLRQKTVALDLVVNIMGDVQKQRVIILDASRGGLNVGVTRAGPRGLAPADWLVKNDATTSVVYSAQAGQFANDGPGSSSPFTIAFLRHLSKPGIGLLKLFNAVADDMEVLTNGRQQLALYVGGRRGGEDFYFRPAAVAPPQPKPLPSVGDQSAEERAWKIINTKKDADELRNYIRTYPNSRHLDAAAIILAETLKNARSGQLERGLAVVTSAEAQRAAREEEIIALMSRGKSYALVIGNQNYKDHAYKILETPIADAKVISEILAEQYGFITRLRWMMVLTRICFS